MEPARSVELAMLLDFYGPLLTAKQGEMMRLRVEEDFSLSEIAESFGVSRQAVHDALRKAEKTLTDMEEKLRLVEKYRRLHGAVARAQEALNRGDAGEAQRILEEMQKEGVYGV
ncbi:MAG: YlxM family DNA-binding protein [Candidatus Spyradocola sp.]|jgi:predicted DNA-binding protein YlxM (UPF0122 family)